MWKENIHFNFFATLTVIAAFMLTFTFVELSVARLAGSGAANEQGLRALWYFYWWWLRNDKIINTMQVIMLFITPVFVVGGITQVVHLFFRKASKIRHISDLTSFVCLCVGLATLVREVSPARHEVLAVCSDSALKELGEASLADSACANVAARLAQQLMPRLVLSMIGVFLSSVGMYLGNSPEADVEAPTPTWKPNIPPTGVAIGFGIQTFFHTVSFVEAAITSHLTMNPTLESLMSLRLYYTWSSQEWVISGISMAWGMMMPFVVWSQLEDGCMTLTRRATVLRHATDIMKVMGLCCTILPFNILDLGPVRGDFVTKCTVDALNGIGEAGIPGSECADIASRLANLSLKVPFLMLVMSVIQVLGHLGNHPQADEEAMALYLAAQKASELNGEGKPSAEKSTS